MDDLDELRAALDAFAQPAMKGGRTAQEERVIAGFDDIQRFVQEHGRVPREHEGADIFERLYAVRLGRLRALETYRDQLMALDYQGLLSVKEAEDLGADIEIDDDALLAELGAGSGSDSIVALKHVRTSAEKRAAEEIANRTVCADFEAFEPLFDQVKRQMKDGTRQTCLFEAKSLDEIREGTFFIVGGQIAYIAEEGEPFPTPFNERRMDSRLRVIYDNRTESNVLKRSLQRALHRDEAARYIPDAAPGPLFSDTWEAGDTESGTIYVLRSRSEHPFVAQNRELIHKIGVTGGKVETRIAHAAKDATYLLAEVDVVATYKLSGINRVKLENLLHRIFAPARLDLTIEDRFGNPVQPREWFLLPLQAIDEAVSRIRAGSIGEVAYEPKQARFVAV